MLIAAINGDIEIVASTLVLAESLHIDKENKENIPDEIKETFKALLESGQPVMLLAPDIFVCERARDLLWTDGIHCGGSADQIHVATALINGCDEFITTNKKKGPLRETVATKLATLGLRVILPHQTQVLPPQYTTPLFTPKEASPALVAKGEDEAEAEIAEAPVGVRGIDVSGKVFGESTQASDASTVPEPPAGHSPDVEPDSEKH